MDDPLASDAWATLTGIDTFIPRGIEKSQLVIALQRAFDLPASTIVNAGDVEACIAALEDHRCYVALHELAGPRFAWKCDIVLHVASDFRPRLKSLARHLGIAFASMDEGEAHGDYLVIFHPDGTCTKDYLQLSDIDDEN
jgi:hypothetical protein